MLNISIIGLFSSGTNCYLLFLSKKKILCSIFLLFQLVCAKKYKHFYNYQHINAQPITTDSLSLSLSLLSLSLSLSHTTHTHTHTLSLSLSLILSHSLSHTRTLSHTHTHTHTLSLSSLSLPLSLSQHDCLHTLYCFLYASVCFRAGCLTFSSAFPVLFLYIYIYIYIYMCVYTPSIPNRFYTLLCWYILVVFFFPISYSISKWGAVFLRETFLNRLLTENHLPNKKSEFKLYLVACNWGKPLPNEHGATTSFTV